MKTAISRPSITTVVADPGAISATFATGTNSADTPEIFREGKTDALLRDYRNWLSSELQLLGNASHHAYSFGQANMAKRAIDELDRELAQTLYVGLDKAAARRALTELEMLAERDTSLTPGLAGLRSSLQVAIAEAEQPVEPALLDTPAATAGTKPGGGSEDV